MRYIKRIALCFLTLLLLAVRTVETRAADGETAASAARYGVVRIWSRGPDKKSSRGSAFGVGAPGEDASIFITNWHVVTGSGSWNAEDATVMILLDDNTSITTDSEGKTVRSSLGAYMECEVLYAKEKYPDVAILKSKTPIPQVTTLPLRRVNEQTDIGKNIYAIGYPRSADYGNTKTEGDYETERLLASVRGASLSSGTISRLLPLERFGDTKCIDHSAHINKGNSGGPLILEDGSVIGINTYSYGDDSRLEYNIAIYIDYAIDVLDRLGIEYELAEETGNGKTPGKEEIRAGIWIALGVVVGVCAVVLFLFVLRKKKVVRTKAVGERLEYSDGALRLQGISGAFARRRFRLSGDISLGQDPRCSIVFPHGTEGISRVHCRIQADGHQTVIVDSGSTCGTIVNGKKLIPGQPKTLAVGDRIILGAGQEEFQITKPGGIV